ncbi:hypothetical protein DINM_004011 [Dirofilaria immitis]|nr:hypothetical protein [Dirofilaria immitis]
MQLLSSLLPLLLTGSYFVLGQSPGRNISFHLCISNLQCQSLSSNSYCCQGVCCLNISGTNFSLGQHSSANILLSNGIRCISSLQCRNILPGSYCYQGICCLNGSDMVKIVSYGGYCTTTIQCKTSGAMCISNICQCAAGSQYNGYSCVAVSSVCPPNHILINGLCYRKVKYGVLCQHTQQCDYIGAFAIIVFAAVN